jgi:hypothetical protein
MGGSGGGGFIPPTSEVLQRKIEKARKEERERLEGDVNRFLQNLISKLSDRDAEATQQKLSEIAEKIADVAEIEQILFGGSVAKHTYVDGLSDVDALVISDEPNLKGKSPQAMINALHKTLNDNLTRDKAQSIEKGKLAVTIRYRDGSEIQLLPAMRSGTKVYIADASGTGWKETMPRVFQRTLSRSNERFNQSLIPAIKLMKSIIADFPKQKQITGYHVESLAVDAVRSYTGPKTPRALLVHLLGHASNRVLRPIQDVTGQSRIVDSDLGRAESPKRRNISQALAGVKRRLEAATSVAQWKALFEE